MDQLVPVDIINKEVEEGSPTLLGCKILKSNNKTETMMDSNEKEENIELMTPWLEMGSNDVNGTPTETSFA